MIKEEATIQNPVLSNKRPEQPDNKDRTLFCINIDKRCTEDILYELFLQAGPIENIIRKEDRNGNLICLIIYKYAESCEYAINILNGITLFNMSLKVQQSQQPGQGGGQSRRQSTNNYQNIRESSSRMNRQGSFDNQTPSASPIDSRMRPPQQNLSNLMAQQFQAVASAEFGTQSNMQNPYSDHINRSVGSNINFESNDNQNNHQSRRNNSYNGNNRGNGHNRGYSNDNRGSRDRNNSNNGFNRNNSGGGSAGWYDQNQQYQQNDRNNRDKRRSYQGDGPMDRSRSPMEKRKNNRF